MASPVPPADIARFLDAYQRINKVFSSVGSFPQGLQLGKADLQVLEAISRQEGITMTRLAESLGVRLSTATGIVDRLVARRLVHRVRNHGDRRIVRLSLTAQGKRIASTHAKQLRAAMARMLGLLSPEEREALVAIIDKIAGATAAAPTAGI